MLRVKGLPGEIHILISATLFAISNTFMKLAVAQVPALQVMWIRFSVAAFLLVVGGVVGWIPLRAGRPWMLVARGLTVSLGALCTFSAVGLTSFANFSILVYTYPIFGTLISSWYFGEPFTFRDGVVLILTFLGVALIMQPSFQFHSLGVFMGRPDGHGLRLGDGLALMAGCFFGVSLAVLKDATKTEGAWMLTLCFYVAVSALLAPTVLPRLVVMSSMGWVLILGIILLGTTAQLFETVGYRRCSVPVGSTLSYWTVLVSIGLGAWLFHEPIGPFFVVGAALIMGCGIYAVHSAAAAPLPLPTGKL